jgi:DNA-binding NarL/FixJ family response regulator
MSDPTITRQSASPAAGLTPQQLQILQMLADGKEGKQIARTLYLTASTISAHIRRAGLSLNATGRTHTVATALRLKLIH